jgi:hypothetical protein
MFDIWVGGIGTPVAVAVAVAVVIEQNMGSLLATELY